MSLNGEDAFFVVQNIGLIFFNVFWANVLLSADDFVSSTCAHNMSGRGGCGGSGEGAGRQHSHTLTQAMHKCLQHLCVREMPTLTYSHPRAQGTCDENSMSKVLVEHVTVLDRLSFS